jgi:CRP-like cAMP-binding protein
VTAIVADLFKDLDAGDLEAVLALGVPKKVMEGEVIFTLGEEAREAYLVRGGCVNLTLPIQVNGSRRDILVEERKEGQLLGWSGLVPPYRFTLQARAAEDTELLALPRSEVESLFSRKPELGYQVASNLARIIGQRLQVFQTMWVRAVQQGVARSQG